MLRDDIDRLLTELISINESKLALFEKIYQIDYDCLHYLNAGDIDKAGRLLKRIESLRDEIDALDHEYGTTTDTILSKLGIDRPAFNAMIEGGGDGPLAQLKTLHESIRDILKRLIGNREKLITRMIEINIDTGIDIKELDLMSKYDIDKLI